MDDDLFTHENGRKVYHASWYHNADYSGCDVSYSKSCSQNSDEEDRWFLSYNGPPKLSNSYKSQDSSNEN